MADKIFPTDFTELTAFNDADKLPIQGSGAADMQYAEAKKLIDASTGLNTVPSGYFPVMGSDGKLLDSEIQPTDVVQNNEVGIINEIPKYLSGSSVGSSGFKIQTITSWLSSLITGLFKANVNINSNTLVGRIGIDNGTRGLSIGLYNNGSEQKIALHPSSGGSVSNTPQWIAKESYVQEYVSGNSATIVSAYAAQQVGDKGFGDGYTYDSETGVLTISDQTESGAPVEIDGYSVYTLLDKYILVMQENDETNDDDINGVYKVTSTGETSLDPIELTKVNLGAIVYAFGPHGKTYIKNRKRATALNGPIIRTYYNALA